MKDHGDKLVVIAGHGRGKRENRLPLMFHVIRA